MTVFVGVEALIFVAKYNPDGTLAWAKKTVNGLLEHSALLNRGLGITTLSDDSVVIHGNIGKALWIAWNG